MADEDRGPSLLTILVIGGAAVIVALMVVGWIIGTIFSFLRGIAVVVLAVAVIVGITSSRSRR